MNILKGPYSSDPQSKTKYHLFHTDKLVSDNLIHNPKNHEICVINPKLLNNRLSGLISRKSEIVRQITPFHIGIMIKQKTFQK